VTLKLTSLRRFIRWKGKRSKHDELALNHWKASVSGGDPNVARRKRRLALNARKVAPTADILPIVGVMRQSAFGELISNYYLRPLSTLRANVRDRFCMCHNFTAGTTHAEQSIFGLASQVD
jgi:hypothetical protein